MPSIHVHLAIGKRYIQKNKVNNTEEFLKGIVAPDFAKSKEKSHYTVIRKSKGNLIEDLKYKVNIEEFLKENRIETDYEKGVFLHILTDKIFFNEFFEEKYLQNVGYKKFAQDLYYSYSIINLYLEKKYNIIFSEEEAKKLEDNIQEAKKLKKIDNIVKGKNILPIDKLEEFIEKMSDINLNEVARKKHKK